MSVMRQAFSPKHLERDEGHGHSGLHVEHAGSPGAAFFDPEGHLGERAERPDCVEVAEQQDGLFAAAPRAGGKAGFDRAATMPANGRAETGGGLSGEVEAAVESGFFGGIFGRGGLKFDKGLKHSEKRFFAFPGGFHKVMNFVVHSC